jgi:hypothetical protein
MPAPVIAPTESAVWSPVKQGSQVVFARSNRSLVVSLSGLVGLVTLAVGDVPLLMTGERVAAPIVFSGAAVALPALLCTVLRLRRWPVSRLGFFRDRLVLVQGRSQLQVSWGYILTATLADEEDCLASLYPAITLTDRLLVRLEPTRRFSFWPATVGLEPAACRDLILRLRDVPSLRQRLPEFDSMLDVTASRPYMGELVRPTLD